VSRHERVFEVQQQDDAKTSGSPVSGLAHGHNRRSAMCDPRLFICLCDAEFEDPQDSIRHVEEIHSSEFNIRDLNETEDAIERFITPTPLV
jgi:hypothetical protein